MARGHIRQRANGTWAAVLSLGRDPVTLKRRQKWLSGPTRKAVQTKLTKALAALDAGTYADGGNLTVAEFLERWLRDYAEARLRPTTLTTYRRLVDVHILPALGSVRLESLRPLQLQDLYRRAQAPGYAAGRGPLAPATVVMLHAVLHRALLHAVRWQLLSRNPADALEPPRAPQEERPVLDLPQMARLLAETAGTWLHLPILLAVGTGMCRGEVLGLRWEDISAKSGALQIRQQVVRAAGVTQFGPLKRPARKRSVSLPELLLEAFERERAAQADLRRDLGSLRVELGLVVCRTDGRPYNPDSLSDAFRRVRLGLGLGVTFHDLRHSHATLLLLLEVHAKIVSERLGHAGVAFTQDTYMHVLPAMQSDVAELVDAALRGAGVS